MAKIEQFEDIEAWQMGRELKRTIYRCSKRGEFGKDFALRDQIRRAAISVTANIAEGFERGGNREFLQFLSHAKGSCGEVRDHLYTAIDEQYISEEEFRLLCTSAKRISGAIAGFMKYLQATEIRGQKFKEIPRDNLKPGTWNLKPQTCP
jgi:four helix bundle protein